MSNLTASRTAIQAFRGRFGFVYRMEAGQVGRGTYRSRFGCLGMAETILQLVFIRGFVILSITQSIFKH
jgi:hypothetical protein